MSRHDLEKLVGFYKHHLDIKLAALPARKLRPVDSSTHCPQLDFYDVMAHVKFTCDEASAALAEGRVEDAAVSVGFVQGVLWQRGHFTLDELAKHSGVGT